MSHKHLANRKNSSEEKTGNLKNRTKTEARAQNHPVKNRVPAEPGPRTEEPGFQGLKKRVPQSQIEKMLIQFGEYPEKHRFIIWKTLLQVPENRVLFESLLKKGEHPCVDYVKSKFPIKDKALSEDFLKVVSAIGFWAPVVVEAEFLPAVIFPFVKLSQGDLLGAFEVSVSFIWNWMHDWFENFPNAPIRYLLQIEDLLKSEDPSLINHLESLSLSPSTYIWPILKYLFAQVMTREELSTLIDHVLTYNSKPQFLKSLSAAYILYYSSTLKSLKSPKDIQGFFVQQNPILIKKLIIKAQSLLSKLPEDPHRLPLLPEYPTFTNYPEFALSLQISVREKLVKQDQEVQLKKSYIKSINQKFEQLEKEEFRLRKEQEALIQAEIEKRKIIALEENIKLEERKKLDEEARKIRLTQIQRVEDTIQKSMKSAEILKKKDQISKQQEFEARGKYDSYESAAKAEEENLSLLEFKAAQRLVEIMRIKDSEESMRKLRTHAENWDREQDQKEKIYKRQMEIENEQRRIDLEIMRQTKLKELELCKEYNNKRRMDVQQHLKSLERELKLLDLEKEKKLRILAEEELLRNEEYLLQMKIKQELMREQDERQFQLLLAQEKEYKMQKNAEMLKQVREEQRKQAVELQRAREENERLEREFENQAVEQKVRQMRKETEYMEREREQMTQEMFEKIERERNERIRIQEDVDRKRSELKERNAYQKVIRDQVDESIQREREQFYRFREEVENETEKIENERKKVYNKKMNEIVRQREETLTELAKPLPKVSSSLKDRIQGMRGYSEDEDEEEEQERSGGFGRVEKKFNVGGNEEIRGTGQGLHSGFNKSEKILQVKDSFQREKTGNFEIKEQFEESLSSSGKPEFAERREKSEESSFRADRKTKAFELNHENEGYGDYRTKKLVNDEEESYNASKNYGHSYEDSREIQEKSYEFQGSPYDNQKNQFLEYELQSKASNFDTEKQKNRFLDYEIRESHDFSIEKPGNYFETYEKPEKKTENPKNRFQVLTDKKTPETIKSQEMFDMEKISEFTKDMKTKKDTAFNIKPSTTFVNNMKKIEEEQSSYSKESDSSHFKADRRRWDDNSYSKCSSNSCESSDLSYHKLEVPKENKFFISKTQKADMEYSEKWDEEGSDSYSSCHSHECSSCVYSSSECSCDYSSKESSQRFVSPGNYHYTSSEYSEDSYVRHSTKT